jgi:hypothetical protein
MELSWINGMLGKFGEQHQRRQRYLNLVGELKIRTDASPHFSQPSCREG